MTEDQTVAKLRKLRRAGKLTGEVDDETARDLLRTPPSTALAMIGAVGDAGDGGKDVSGAVGFAALTDTAATLRALEIRGDEPIADLVRRLEEDCDAFGVALAENTRLAREHMHRSLLQLFEDTIREKLPDALGAAARGGAAAAAAGGGALGAFGRVAVVGGIRQLAASRRPVDKGLERGAARGDVLIPQHVRDGVSRDLQLIVEHELKRALSAIGTDVQKILAQVVLVRNRVAKLEEELLQRDVDDASLKEQLERLTQQLAESQAEMGTVRQHLHDREHQMDLVREQLTRRNEALDQTRVRFRKEVMRCKSRIYELEAELDTLHNRRRGVGAPPPPAGQAKEPGAGAAAPTPSQVGERRGSSAYGLGATALAGSAVSATGAGALPPASPLSGDQGDDDITREITAAAETAVREAQARFDEEMRQAEVRHAREKKALTQELNMKVLERDGEILRLKRKLATLQAANSPANEAEDH